mgnify:FL=1
MVLPNVGGNHCKCQLAPSRVLLLIGIMVAQLFPLSTNIDVCISIVQHQTDLSWCSGRTEILHSSAII